MEIGRGYGLCHFLRGNHLLPVQLVSGMGEEVRLRSSRKDSNSLYSSFPVVFIQRLGEGKNECLGCRVDRAGWNGRETGCGGNVKDSPFPSFQHGGEEKTAEGSKSDAVKTDDFLLLREAGGSKVFSVSDSSTVYKNTDRKRKLQCFLINGLRSFILQKIKGKDFHRQRRIRRADFLLCL